MVFVQNGESEVYRLAGRLPVCVQTTSPGFGWVAMKWFVSIVRGLYAENSEVAWEHC